jgi:Phasin protein
MMTRQNEFFTAFPVDARVLWDMNGKSLDYAEKAYRMWLQAAGEMQGNAMAFLHGRLEKDVAAMTRCGRCKTPAELLNVQADYAGHMFADLVSEGQKIVACLNKAVLSGASGEAAELPAGGKAARHSTHRAAGH